MGGMGNEGIARYWSRSVSPWLFALACIKVGHGYRGVGGVVESDVLLSLRVGGGQR